MEKTFAFFGTLDKYCQSIIEVNRLVPFMIEEKQNQSNEDAGSSQTWLNLYNTQYDICVRKRESIYFNIEDCIIDCKAEINLLFHKESKAKCMDAYHRVENLYNGITKKLMAEPFSNKIDYPNGSWQEESPTLLECAEELGGVLGEVLKRFYNFFRELFKDENVGGAGQSTTENIESLENLFIEIGQFNKAISALKKVAVIDSNCSNIIGSKLKGVMQVWVNILRNEKKYLKAIKDKNLTTLLNKQFINLNLSEKTEGKHFRNPINKTASNLYRSKLLALM